MLAGELGDIQKKTGNTIADPSYPRALLQLLKNDHLLCSETRSSLNRVRSMLGDRYAPLLLHPGILSRIEELIKFAIYQKIPEPERLFNLFSDHLGVRFYYRGLAISEQVKSKITASGMESNYSRRGGSYIGAVERILAEGVSSLKRQHTSSRRNLDNSPLMSLADDEELAAHVARGQTSEDTRNFVFWLRIPQILTIGGNNAETAGAGADEHFAFYRIEEDQIKQVSEHGKNLQIFASSQCRPWWDRAF